MSYLLVDHNLLDPVVVTQHYSEKYNTIPKEQLNSEGQALCDMFGQTIAPMTVLAEGGSFQKVLPAFVYLSPENIYILNWVAGTEIPLDEDFKTDVDIIDINDKPCKVIIVTLEGKSFAFPFRKDNPLKGKGEKAGKLSDLSIGEHRLEGSKLIKTDFGIKTIVVVQGKEYWANTQMSQLLHITQNLPKSPGEYKVLDKTLKVVSKGTTTSGHPYVRVGLA